MADLPPRRAFLAAAASLAASATLGGCAEPVALRPPRRVPWKMKALESAQTRLAQLPDGRLRLDIRHDTLRGVTPAMLVWWFRNLDGEMNLDGSVLPSYLVWHPVDHIAIRYARRRPDGTIGPGAQIHIQEAFAARPEYLVDAVTTIEKLDESGFVHVARFAGVETARLEYAFTPTKDGTLYENSLTVGPGTPLARPVFNSLIRPRAFPDDKGRAWLRHNVEEVGNFEFFLPALYRGRRA